MKEEGIIEVFNNLDRRNITYDKEKYRKIIGNYFKLKLELEEIRRKRNIVTDAIKSDDEIAKNIKILHTTKLEEFKNAESEYQKLLIPNMLDESVPNGKNFQDNQTIYTEGKFNFHKHHYDMNIFYDVSKISGSRFVILKHEFAKLERALIAYAMDRLYELGFEEYSVPYIMNQKAAAFTRHERDLSDMFTTDDKFLIPTGENQLLCLAYQKKLSILPWKVCTITDCFRKEAGAAGKDTKGLIRLHQFKKVEMVVFASPEDSNRQLEIMTSYTEDLLRSLNLPFRKVLLCSGDTGIRSKKTYDLEIGIGNEWRECASISNCGNYQTKTLECKFNSPENKSGKFASSIPHALNGTYLASGRITAAILEHHYNPNTGKIQIPLVLYKYLPFKTIEIN